MTAIRGNHHLTLSVGGAQEDFDFHTGVLGLRPIKKTVLYDGSVPIYHLYYGNAHGDAGAIITVFPMRQLGLMGRAGSNQVKRLNFSVPDSSLDWWSNRLDDNRVAWERADLFGQRRIQFAHPCGIGYAFVGESDGSGYGEAWGGNGVPAEHGIRGTYGITASVLDLDPMDHYLTVGLGATLVEDEGANRSYEIGTTGAGRVVELAYEPDVRPGTWHFAEGTVHHIAYDIGDADAQQQAKAHIEGIGYTDVTEMKDRGYFFSVYNRSPGGPLVELAWSNPEGWTMDEPEETLGTEFMLPPQFEHQRAEILASLEPLSTP
jgi:glyoxalase family protein